jgi:type VI protein secretion system component VasF
MPTTIVPNGRVGQRAERVADVRRLRQIVNDLRDALRDWETLTAAQRNAATRTMLRAVIALLRHQIGAIDERSRGAS